MNDPQNPSGTPAQAHDILDSDRYTPEEAAELLGMNLNVIYQAVHRGTLPALKIGNDIVSIDRGDLVHWLETR